jgi:hypothetical protein
MPPRGDTRDGDPGQVGDFSVTTQRGPQSTTVASWRPEMHAGGRFPGQPGREPRSRTLGHNTLGAFVITARLVLGNSIPSRPLVQVRYVAA